MSDVWIIVLAVGLATVVFKAAGPLFLGRRPLGARTRRLVDLLAPVMLTALAVTQTVGGDEEIVLDERIPGLAAAGVAIWLRAHIVVTMATAAVVTALLRQLG